VLLHLAGGPGVSCTVVETAMWLNLLHPLLFPINNFFYLHATLCISFLP